MKHLYLYHIFLKKTCIFHERLLGVCKKWLIGPTSPPDSFLHLQHPLLITIFLPNFLHIFSYFPYFLLFSSSTSNALTPPSYNHISHISQPHIYTGFLSYFLIFTILLHTFFLLLHFFMIFVVFLKNSPWFPHHSHITHY